jgi:hypothetical protein
MLETNGRRVGVEMLASKQYLPLVILSEAKDLDSSSRFSGLRMTAVI